MKSTLTIAIAALAVLGIARSTSAAPAGFYSGRFPLTVTEAQHFNGKHCLIF